MLQDFRTHYSNQYHFSLLQLQHSLRHSIWISKKNYSAELQLIKVPHDLAYSLNNKGQTEVVLLDFSKAFNKVSHHLLLTKLQHYGI